MVRSPSPWSGVSSGDLLGLLGLLGLSSCGYTFDLYNCENPCYACEDPCNKCPDGECVPLSPVGWEGPLLLWSGSPVEAPSCPERAINVVYEGHAELRARTQCTPCECGPSACELPGEIVTSSAVVCPHDGSGLQSFDAPNGWNGACVSPGTIPAAEFTSMTMAGPTVRPCEPVMEPVPAWGSLEWHRFARACRSADALRGCDDPTKQCAPTSTPPPPGFSQCLYKEGEQLQCPTGYPDRRVFYSRTEGEFGCTDCQCGPPEGSDCSVSIITYTDTACNNVLFPFAVELESPVCVIGMTSGDLAGMSASFLTNIPGECTASGGQPFGEVAPADPSTFCCQFPQE